MAETSSQILTAAKVLAQDSGTPALLAGATDYDKAVDNARLEFGGDRPNKRIVHYTVVAAASRFVLAGTGAILSGLDEWVSKRSRMEAVWCPYDTTNRDREPLSDEDWRVFEEPTVTALELQVQAAVNDVLRLEFVVPHEIDIKDPALTTIVEDDLPALHLLTAAYILEMYAARSLQNTGNTGLMSDVVDRRTPLDQARSMAKDYRARYATLVGRSDSTAESRPLSSIGSHRSTPSFGSTFVFPRGGR